MDDATMRDKVSSARVGHLSTVAASGVPHIVPVCFCLVGDVAYHAVDHKPKTSTRLRRIANLDASAHACLLVDAYDDEDWSRLWWVRADGTGRVVEDPGEREVALVALAAKYPQYADVRPSGTVIAMDVLRFTGWAASPSPDPPEGSR